MKTLIRFQTMIQAIVFSTWVPLLLALTVCAQDSSIRDIRGGVHQLFLDDWIVAEETHVERRQGQPVKRADNPILKRDKPWDAARCDLYGSAVYDPQHKRIQLFYSAHNTAKGHEERLAYAESRDAGQTWVKPEFDLIPFGEDLRTNLVMLPPSGMMAGPCVFRDDHASDPARRYKLFTSSYPDAHYLGLPGISEVRGQFQYLIANPTLPPNCAPPGMFVAYSPDGIHWKIPALRISNIISDTAQSAFWDERIGKYVGYVRARTENGRSVARMESDDFEHWTNPVVVLEGTPNKSLYSMGVNRYQGIYIGTLWIFEPSANSTDKPVIWPELAVSRDGIAWTRPFPGEPLVPCGPPGSADSRQIRMASSFVVLSDRILLFYGQTDRPHIPDMRADIGMATLRRDGFAAMTAGDTEGSILTKLIRFEAGRLCVNAKVNFGGYLRAEILDANGQPLAGYDLASCADVQGDVLWAPIEWKALATIPSSDFNNPCRIRFVLKNAEFYSFGVEQKD
jgi:hypothetical protein